MAKKNNICVIGAGRFGLAIIEQLIEQDNSVLVIDSNDVSLSKVPQNSPLVSSVVLDAADINALQAIGIQEFETVIVALTNNIEIVAALLELNVQHIIARAGSQRHARVLHQIGVDVIVRPEHESGTRTAIIAMNSNFIKFSKRLTEIGDGFVIGSSLLVNDRYVNISIKDLGFAKLGVTLVLIKRSNQTFLPSGLVKLNLGDTLTVVGKVKDVTNFFGMINIENIDSSKSRRTKIKSRIKKFGTTKSRGF